MSSVFFFTLLLFEFKLSLFFGFSLLAGSLFKLAYVFFILLLKACCDLVPTPVFSVELFLRVSLTALRVVRLLLDLCSDRWAESQVIEIF